jgi:hypothetical protein
MDFWHMSSIHQGIFCNILSNKMAKLRWHAFYTSYQSHKWHGIPILSQTKKSQSIRWLGFAIKCPLQLNGWNDMGLATHEWLVAYVPLDYNVVAKPRRKT